MAVIMFGDFVGYSISQYTRYWQTGNGIASINASGGRMNSGYLAFGTGATSFIRSKTFTPIASGVLGFAVYCPASSANSHLCSLLDGAVEHIRLTRNADGTLSVTRAGTALTDGTSVTSFADSLWHWVELKFSIADSIGASAVQVWVNGVLAITVATGQDCRNGGNASINSFALGRFASGSTILQRHGEFYLDDGTTPLGDRRVETLAMTGNGTTQDFTSSSGGHYTDVDDATADDDSTYVESATVNHVELFTVSNLSSTPTEINAVSVWNCVEKTDAGPKQFAAVVRQSSTNYAQTTANATEDYHYNTPIMLVDPATASAWTESGVNSIEAGLKVVA